jgi:hypothetical protein
VITALDSLVNWRVYAMNSFAIVKLMAINTQIKRLSLAAVAALALSIVTGLAVLAATPCNTPTPDCPQINCDE